MDNIVIEPGALDRIIEFLPRAHAYAVVADSTVAELYGEQVSRSVPNATLLTFPAGESNKTRESWATISDAMLERGYGRDCCVVALGGGVTGDLAGFVAATYMRGVPVVQVPTTLLAMIDASIGGKTGVDTAAGKNLVGAFHQPAKVIIDPNVLRTLPDAQLSAGLAEAIKHGAIADRAYLDWIIEAANAIFERRTQTLDSLIRRSVEIKLDHVREDPHERGKRAALNFGHTIAHAFEHILNYGIAHGDAVAAGMSVEAHIGVTLGLTDRRAPQAIERAAAAARLPLSIPAIEVEAVIHATRADKKARSGAVRYTLLREIGVVARPEEGEWTTPVADDVVRETLQAQLLGRMDGPAMNKSAPRGS